MAWKDIKTTNYTGTSGSNIVVKLQYDDAKDTPTSRVIRFTGNGKNNDSYEGNGYYVLWDPGSTSNEKLLKVKAPGSNWSTAGSVSITITKAYNAQNFSIPIYWICNTGSVTPDLTKRTIKYDDFNGSIYDCFKNGGKRQSYRTTQASFTTAGKKATDVGIGTTTITDNYNNTFTITASKGTNGDYNTAGGPINLKYTYSLPSVLSDPTKYGNSTYKSGTPVALAISGTADTRTVYAISTTTADHGGSKHAYTSAKIKQYIAPSDPGTPVLSYTKSRLTIKEKWTFTWTAADAANTTSPIKGYRIRLYKNGETIAIIDSSGKCLSKLRVPGSKDYIYDRDSTSTTITIDPIAHGFVPGDTVKLSIFAYTKDGLKNDGSKLLFSGGGSTAVCSAESTVQNAGVILVKHNNNWVEGQVLVKHNNTWVEAEAVLVKHNGSWKESTS
jgi:hypothetical protein